MTRNGLPIARLVLASSAIAFVLGAGAHGTVSAVEPTERSIDFPDTAHYETVVLDLHTHSVFSDGHVWPSIRVAEAIRDGLDGLAITEHLEWQPHLTDIPHPDRNRAAEEAARAAAGLSLLVIPGVEVTRSDEPGHINAVFVEDANALIHRVPLTDYLPEHVFETEQAALEFATTASADFRGAHRADKDGREVWIPFADAATYFTLINYTIGASRPALEVLVEARSQGAFTFWNHPSFATPDAGLPGFHREAIEAGLLGGVEIANGSRYYENAFRLALEHDLTLIGTSDVHNLIDWSFEPHRGGHRPVTLAFATAKTSAAIKEALVARRTVVWWKNTLLGRAAELEALADASIVIERVEVWANGMGFDLYVANRSDVRWLLEPTGSAKFSRDGGVIELHPHESRRLAVVLERDGTNSIALPFSISNALIAPKEPLEWELVVSFD